MLSASAPPLVLMATPPGHDEHQQLLVVGWTQRRDDGVFEAVALLNDGTAVTPSVLIARGWEVPTPCVGPVQPARQGRQSIAVPRPVVAGGRAGG